MKKRKGLDAKWIEKQKRTTKDLLVSMSVTLDTTQLLISALNALALKKAIVFFWEEEEEK